MQMMVKPVLADAPAIQEPVVGARNPAAVNRPGSSFAPLRRLGLLLSSFIDIVEPVIARLNAGNRLVAVESEDGVDLTFHSASRRRAVAIGTSAEAQDDLARKLKRMKVREVELRLDPGRLTSVRFKLPAAGIDFAHQIIEGRLDRLTPWRADAVLYGFALSRKAGGDGQFEVDFAATSKAIAATSLDRLSQYGLTATTLGSAELAMTEPLRIDLLGGKNQVARKARRRAVGLAVLFLLAVSALFYGATLYSLNESRHRIAELDATLAKARNRLVQASGSSSERDQDFAFITTKVPEEARFHLIDRLATLLPDTTYLDALDIEPGAIRIAGSSTDASGLINLLEADAVFAEAKFVAPVMRQDDGRDRFEITATFGVRATDFVP